MSPFHKQTAGASCWRAACKASASLPAPWHLAGGKPTPVSRTLATRKWTRRSWQSAWNGGAQTTVSGMNWQARNVKLPLVWDVGHWTSGVGSYPKQPVLSARPTQLPDGPQKTTAKRDSWLFNSKATFPVSDEVFPLPALNWLSFHAVQILFFHGEAAVAIPCYAARLCAGFVQGCCIVDAAIPRPMNHLISALFRDAVTSKNLKLNPASPGNAVVPDQTRQQRVASHLQASLANAVRPDLAHQQQCTAGHPQA